MTFTFKQFSVNQDRCAMKIGTDGVLLGAWTPLINNPYNVLDIGAGTGILSIMLAKEATLNKLTPLKLTKTLTNNVLKILKLHLWGDKLFCFHAVWMNLWTNLKMNMI